MRRLLILVLFALATVGGAAFWFRGEIVCAWRSFVAERGITLPGPPRPDPQAYARLVTDLKRWRGEIATRHRAARNDGERDAAERDARALLETALPAMMRCWLGTPWDFNGTAATPGGGKIACGYFVSTVLMDAGFRVDRYQLAQQPSGNILRTFLAKDQCSLTVGQPYDQFRSATAARDPGIYLTGLDTHVAFIVIDGSGDFRFIHSSGSKPWRVVDESPEEAGVLRQSRWRMLGNLTADRESIRRWLRQEPIMVFRS
jgi:hypothetical protein